ncbi:putative glucosidase II beta subunit-like protein [Trichinella nativa]|uniref:Putative glucosidase II beta subunit-like protein n=1 Tax=Trichinella nativa TaxID=6335 RepID=A0A1Y3EXM0_9BILA|nr:putative glucosidase II beta subunit-like protein [Trichinella nativa]
MTELNIKSELPHSIFFLIALLISSSCVFCFEFYDVDEAKYGIYEVSIDRLPVSRTTVFAKDEIKDTNADSLTPQSDVNKKSLIVTSKHGVEFFCTVPNVDFDIIRRRHAESKLHLGNVTTKSITDALEILKNTCLGKVVGWWTYEFCNGKYVRQYHTEDGKVVQPTLMLGMFGQDYDWSNQSDVVAKFGDTKQNVYHSQIFKNGTICNLNNEFRQSEIRFFCDFDFNGAYLYSVDEPVSCQYVFNVHISTLCQLPAFVPPESKPETLRISCQPIVGEHQSLRFRTEDSETVSWKSPSKRNHIESRKKSNNIKDEIEADKLLDEREKILEAVFKGQPLINIDFSLTTDENNNHVNNAEEADSMNSVKNEESAFATKSTTKIADSLKSLVETNEISDDNNEKELRKILNDGQAEDAQDVDVTDVLKELQLALKILKEYRSNGVSKRPNPFLPDDKDHDNLFDELFNDSKNNVLGEKMKVRVAVNRIKTIGVPEEARGKILSESQRLEKEIESRLAKAGLDPGTRKIKIKLITPHEDGSEFSMFSNADAGLIANMLSTMIGTTQQQAVQERRLRQMEDNYNVRFDEEENADLMPNKNKKSTFKKEKQEKAPQYASAAIGD